MQRSYSTVTATKEEDQFISLVEVTKHIPITQESIRNWVKQGKVRSRMARGKRNTPTMLVSFKDVEDTFYFSEAHPSVELCLSSEPEEGRVTFRSRLTSNELDRVAQLQRCDDILAERAKKMARVYPSDEQRRVG